MFSRVDLEAEVGLESESNFYTGLTQDISSGGLFVATHQTRPVGDRLVLKFALPGRPAPITVEAEVRWVRQPTSIGAGDGTPGMGLQFVNITPEDKAAINTFIQQRESLFYDE